MKDQTKVLALMTAIWVPRAFVGLGVIALIGVGLLGALASRGGRRQ